jgi:hypothetical protein
MPKLVPLSLGNIIPEPVMRWSNVMSVTITLSRKALISAWLNSCGAYADLLMIPFKVF